MIVAAVDPGIAFVQRFIDYAKDAAVDCMGDAFWRTEMHALFGDEELARLTGETKFGGRPNFESELLSAYESRGVTGLKAAFLAGLYASTDARDIGGIAHILEKIIEFQ